MGREDVEGMRLSDLKNIVEQTLHFTFPSRVQGDAFTKEVGRISGVKAEHDDFGYVRVQNSGNQEKKIRQAAARHGGHAGSN